MSGAGVTGKGRCPSDERTPRLRERDFRTWARARLRVHAGGMPPRTLPPNGAGAVAADGARPGGLTTGEATSRLAVDGPNRLNPPPPPSPWRKLIGEFTHFFALMLWVAGVLAFVAGMPQLGVAIFVVIVVNGLFAFLQEERAERAGGGGPGAIWRTPARS